jgi:SPX domain protein involved in polyphosphate accumulation
MTLKSPLKTNIYRFERKYVIPHSLKKDIEFIIKTSPFSCRSIHQPRQVNNIYFDGFLLQNYLENIDGHNKRSKYRIRWYGELFDKIKNIKLEIKIKQSLLGHKELYLLNAFDTRKGILYDDVYSLLTNSKLPFNLMQKLKFMKPALLNSYQRKYYESFDRKIRVTIDDKLFYQSLLSEKFTSRVVHNSYSILELKYNHADNDYASKLASILPIKQTKYSKYITGINSFRAPI